jgi:hypothetical protein
MYLHNIHIDRNFTAMFLVHFPVHIDKNSQPCSQYTSMEDYITEAKKNATTLIFGLLI